MDMVVSWLLPYILDNGTSWLYHIFDRQFIFSLESAYVYAKQLLSSIYTY